MEYYQILLPLALLLLISKLFMKICTRFGLPSVIGMLLAGVLVGLIQYIPGQDVLNATTMTGLGFIAKVGVILIMFSAGLETDLGQIRSIGKPAVIITLAGVVVPLGLGFLVATLCNGGFGALDNHTALVNLFYGVILTATSVSISVATLRELGKLNTRVGSTIVAAAIIDDILGMVVLSFILALEGDGGVTGGAGDNPWAVLLKIVVYFIGVAILAIAASRFFRWLDNRFPHHRLIPIYSLAFCFIIAYVGERWFGIADITGAYFAGIVICNLSATRDYVASKTNVLGYMLFSPLFFASIGIKTDLEGLTGTLVLFAVTLTVIAILSKIIGCGLGARLMGFRPYDSLSIGLGMVSRGEVALIVAQKGEQAGLIDSSLFPAIVLVVIVTTLGTPILLKFGMRRQTPDNTEFSAQEAAQMPKNSLH